MRRMVSFSFEISEGTGHGSPRNLRDIRVTMVIARQLSSTRDLKLTLTQIVTSPATDDADGLICCVLCISKPLPRVAAVTDASRESIVVTKPALSS